ncbi:MAG: N-acetylglucosamine-6-phosphate deacetylase, partial [Candidatus Rifleibacteriota bacterium]
LIENSEKPGFINRNNYAHPQDRASLATDIEGYRLPGVIDMHFHGAFGWDFSFGDVDKINEMLDKVLTAGISGIVATLITCPESQRIKAIKDIVEVIKTRKKPPFIHGIYLEGPFLAENKRGSHPAHLLEKPDFKKFAQWQDAAEGNIKIVTVAPELDGAIEFIEKATKTKVVCALGHSDADWEQTEKAIEAGASHITHLFNAMPAFHHRQPNLLSCVLTNENVTLELIGDGIHVSPDIVKFVCSTFEGNRIMLISDCIAPAGLPDGGYNFYNTNLKKMNGKCCAEPGKLFGGSRTLVECFKELGESKKVAWGQLGASVWRNPSFLLKAIPPETEIYFDLNFNWRATKCADMWYWNRDNEV